MKRYMIYKQVTKEMWKPINQNYYYDEQQLQEEVDRICGDDKKMSDKICIFAEDVGETTWT